MCVFVYTQLICPSFTVVFTFPQLRNLWYVIISFPSQISWWIKTHSLKSFNFPWKPLWVHLWLYIHTYMANIYTHTVLSLVLMQVGSWKKCRSSIVFLSVLGTYCKMLCIWNIFCGLSNIYKINSRKNSKWIDFIEILEIGGPCYLWLEPYLCIVKFAFLCQHSDCFIC